MMMIFETQGLKKKLLDTGLVDSSKRRVLSLVSQIDSINRPELKEAVKLQLTAIIYRQMVVAMCEQPIGGL